jgi:predicted RNase H-like HicB family nuclease
MKTLKLPVLITQDEDGYFLAEVSVLTSCFTQGKTKEEALSNIKEVIQLCLEHVERLPQNHL